MFTLLILADDFTGALDTGVQISKTGARTVVLTDPHADLERFADETEVLVIDAETRHIPAAGKGVRGLHRPAGIRHEGALHL